MLKFWQVIAAVIILKLADAGLAMLADRSAGEIAFVVLVWALASALIWVVCRLVFRAVDNVAKDDPYP